MLGRNPKNVIKEFYETDRLVKNSFFFLNFRSKSVANGNNAVDLQLKVPKSNLLTFAIFSRDFGADISKGPHSRRSTVA